jgi:hypothetical protein
VLIPIGVSVAAACAQPRLSIPPVLRHAIKNNYIPSAARTTTHPYRYPYVTRHYRIGGTYGRCLLSLFELHTETLNAWTMIWGCCLSGFLLWRALAALFEADAGAGSGDGGGGGGGFWRGVPDEMPFYLLTGSTLLHAPWSIGFHLFRGMVRPSTFCTVGWTLSLVFTSYHTRHLPAHACLHPFEQCIAATTFAQTHANTHMCAHTLSRTHACTHAYILPLISRTQLFHMLTAATLCLQPVAPPGPNLHFPGPTTLEGSRTRDGPRRSAARATPQPMRPTLSAHDASVGVQCSYLVAAASPWQQSVQQ